MRGKHVIAIACVLWEALWAYVYFTAPDPDTQMSMIFAQLMGIVVPIWLALAVLMAIWITRSARPK